MSAAKVEHDVSTVSEAVEPSSLADHLEELFKLLDVDES